MLPLAGDSDHARRIRFGRYLAANRNRVFDLRPGLTVRLTRRDVVRHDKKAAWSLAIFTDCGGVRVLAGVSSPDGVLIASELLLRSDPPPPRSVATTSMKSGPRVCAARGLRIWDRVF